MYGREYERFHHTFSQQQTLFSHKNTGRREKEHRERVRKRTQGASGEKDTEREKKEHFHRASSLV